MKFMESLSHMLDSAMITMLKSLMISPLESKEEKKLPLLGSPGQAKLPLFICFWGSMVLKKVKFRLLKCQSTNQQMKIHHLNMKKSKYVKENLLKELVLSCKNHKFSIEQSIKTLSTI